MKSISLLTFAALLLVGCSAYKSAFDEVFLVWSMGTPIEEAKIPEGFTVTPEEIKEVIPLTKYGWNIYADGKFYYLSSGIQKISSKTGDNSYLAAENGIRIEGKSRGTLVRIKDDIKASGFSFITPERLRELTNQVEQVDGANE